MTGVRFQIEIDDRAASARLAGLLARMDDPRAFYKSVAELLLTATQNRIVQERGPDGAPWVPLRPSTIKGRIRKKLSPSGILRARGRLIGSLNASSTQAEARVGTNVVYAAIHQFGGTINRTARTGRIFRGLERDGSVGRRFVAARRKRKVETEVQIPAYQIVIPARPYLGASLQDQDDILEAAELWLGGP